MTPELTALLQKEATQDEWRRGTVPALTTVGELAQQEANRRRTIALVTMRECAKLVCKGCRKGVPLVRAQDDMINHEANDYGDRLCWAEPIHAAISEAEAAQ